jgi:hypothetical protein
LRFIEMAELFILIGIGLAIKALTLVLDDVEPDGTHIESGLNKRKHTKHGP